VHQAIWPTDIRRSRRTKKLIGAAAAFYNKCGVTCAQCKSAVNPEEKMRKRGCLGPVDDAWTMTGCPLCSGLSKDCGLCHGTNKITTRECPRALARLSEVSWLFSHFMAYKNSKWLAWPNGKGRFYQPIRLISAFDLWARLDNRWNPKNELEE